VTCLAKQNVGNGTDAKKGAVEVRPFRIQHLSVIKSSNSAGRTTCPQKDQDSDLTTCYEIGGFATSE
jgi:hypothetical protein